MAMVGTPVGKNWRQSVALELAERRRYDLAGIAATGSLVGTFDAAGLILERRLSKVEIVAVVIVVSTWVSTALDDLHYINHPRFC